MSKSNERASKNCEAFEDILIKRQTGFISEKDEIALKRHLKSCDNCQKLETTLVRMQKLAAEPYRHMPKPNPVIQRNLREKVKRLQPVRENYAQKIWSAFKSILDYRVPVYQVVSGVAIFLICFFVWRSFFEAEANSKLRFSSVAQLDTVRSVPFDSMNFSPDDSAQSSNVREDSMLIKFVVTSM